MSFAELFLLAVYTHYEPSLGVWPKDHRIGQACIDRVCEESSCVKREAVAAFVWWWEMGRHRKAA